MSVTVSGAQPVGVRGPAWADASHKGETVLNPLRVQSHVRRTVGAYVPGVTAVTAHARYYGLHPWLAAVAGDEGLDHEAFLDVVRRCEVVLAWASEHHDEHLVDLPIAHGRDALGRFTSADGALDLTRASATGSYSSSTAGFLGTAYRNPEITLALLERSWKPGARFDNRARTALDTAFAGLVDTAHADSLTASDGAAAANAGWCICHARTGSEGAWLRDLLCGRLAAPPALHAKDLARRAAIQLLVRAIAATPADELAVEADVEDEEEIDRGPERLLRAALCFSGPLGTVPAAAGLIDAAERWRGLLLRHYTVTAWRRLWADIVDVAGTGATTAEISARIAADCPSVTVAEFSAHHKTIDGDLLLAAEDEAWADHPGPQGHLAVLCISAQRIGQVSETAARVLRGDDTIELGPGWLATEIAQVGGRPLAAWAGELCTRLLERAQRIGLDKFRVDRVDGRAVVPCQVLERDGVWYKHNEVGRSPLGLRIGPLATILAGAGVLDRHDGVWAVGENAAGLGLL